MQLFKLASYYKWHHVFTGVAISKRHSKVKGKNGLVLVLIKIV